MTFQEELQHMQRAKAEKSRITKLNEEFSRENSRRKAQGRVILRLPHKIEQWVNDAYEREMERTTALRAKTPEQWEADILMLPLSQREAVAKIIFWDYFGARIVTERWPHLDKWLSQTPITTPPAALAKALWACGYTAHAATTRANQ